MNMPEMTGYGKLSARAYTESNGTQVYEGGLSGLPSTGTANFKASAINIDINGNYSIDTSLDGGTPVTLPYSITTNYNGVKCTFTWQKPSIVEIEIYINNPSYKNYEGIVCNDYSVKTTNSNYEEFANIILSNNNIILTVNFAESNPLTFIETKKVAITSVGNFVVVSGHTYEYQSQYLISSYKVNKATGTTNGMEWKIKLYVA